MLQKNEDGIEWLEFELLAEQKKLTHRVYLKHGGFSEGNYQSLNFSYQVGDNSAHVDANMRKISHQLSLNTFVRGKLSHANRVVTVDHKKTDPDGPFDGIITNSPHLGLLITHADCQATILYDPINHVVANIHCGWRGNIANIYEQAVCMMHEKYRSKPENLLAGISPSLGPQHAEFVNYKTEWPKKFWNFIVSPNHFDLWAIARNQLEDCGLLPQHIECANLCTYSEPENFFSYRRQKDSGRHGTIAFLN